MTRLLFLIRSFESGGAERQLLELVKGLDKDRFAVTVVSFYDGGALRPELEAIKRVESFSLHKKSRWDILPFLWRLWRVLRERRPHIVHGYMGVANELGLLAGRATGAKVVWGLRASNMDFSHYDWASAWVFRVGAWPSRFSNLIIVNSHAGKQHHIAHGYSGKRMVVIPNGINIERFHPNSQAGKQMRREWGIGEERLIGLVARLDPMKDHPTFLQAAALLARERQDVRFVCVGDGPAQYKQDLLALTTNLGLEERVLWAGACHNISAVYNTLDIATSSSYGEGFPNVIGEAMACGVPCVVTDVGDSASIVGNIGQVVPPKNPQMLMRAWAKLLDLPGEQLTGLRNASRARIVREYSIHRMVSKTEEMLESILR